MKLAFSIIKRADLNLPENAPLLNVSMEIDHLTKVCDELREALVEADELHAEMRANGERIPKMFKRDYKRLREGLEVRRFMIMGREQTIYICFQRIARAL